jgi:hypothetical protein
MHKKRMLKYEQTPGRVRVTTKGSAYVEESVSDRGSASSSNSRTYGRMRMQVSRLRSILRPGCNSVTDGIEPSRVAPATSPFAFQEETASDYFSYAARLAI